MIQTKVTSTEKVKFVLCNVAETWNQASGRKEEASIGGLSALSSRWCRAQFGSQHVGEAKNHFVVGKSQKKCPRTVLETAELGLRERTIFLYLYHGETFHFEEIKVTLGKSH